MNKFILLGNNGIYYNWYEFQYRVTIYELLCIFMHIYAVLSIQDSIFIATIIQSYIYIYA